MKKGLVRKKTFKPRIIGIIGGKGMMGRWFTRFFRSQGFEVLVADLDTKLTPVQLARRSDVIMLAVPMAAMKQVVREIIPHTRPEQLLTDVSSLKESFVKEMLRSPASVIGMHPMFGPFSKNMKGKPVILCPVRCSPAQKAWLKKIMQKEGAQLHEMSPHKNDELMATVQVLMHMQNIILAETLKLLRTDVRIFLKFAAPPSRIEFDCMGRILYQNPHMYAAIATMNPKRHAVLYAYKKAFMKFHRLVRSGDTKKTTNEFARTGRAFKNHTAQCQRESDLLIEHLTNTILT